MSGGNSELPHVERIETDYGSHIEPPCDESWDDLTKLRWHLAVALIDGGSPDIRAGVYDGGASRKVKRRKGLRMVKEWEPVPGQYSFIIGPASMASYSFGQAWTFINGFSAGLRAAKEG